MRAAVDDEVSTNPPDILFVTTILDTVKFAYGKAIKVRLPNYII
jgi:hypothetical protein